LHFVPVCSTLFSGRFIFTLGGSTVNKQQIAMLAESARTLANSCDAVAESGEVNTDTIDSLRRKLNAVKADGKGLARKRK